MTDPDPLRTALPETPAPTGRPGGSVPVSPTIPSGTERSAGGEAWDSLDAWAAAGAAALALVLRATLALLSPVVGADAYAFVMFARELRRGDWTQGLADGIHPGYPMAIAAVERMLGSYETAGYVVSVLFSSLVIVPFYALVRDIAGRRVALASALLLACFPFHILIHADIRSDGLFHFFFVCSITLSWFGAARGGWMTFGLAGLTGGLAYLTRPEGIYAPLAALGATGLAIAAAMLRRRPVPFARIAPTAMSVVLFLCVSYPLMARFREMTGRWVPSKRGSVETILKTLRGEAGPGLAGSPKFRSMLLAALVAGGVAVPSAGLALWAGRRRFNIEGTAYWMCLAAGYALPVLAAAAGGYPVSRRHMLLPILLLLPFVPILGITLMDLLAGSWPARRKDRVATWILALTLVALAVRGVHPRRANQLPIKEAALWVKQRFAPTAAVHSNTSKIMCYLEKRTVVLPSISAVLEALHLREGDCALVLERHLMEENPQGLEILGRRFVRIARFPPDGGGSKTDAVSVFAGSPLH